MKLPKITPDMQMHRLKDLWEATHGDENPEEFFKSRIGRTYSSLEEELVAGLPLFDQKEQEELMAKALAIVNPLGLQFPDQRAFKAVSEKDAELGKNLTALGLMNFQHLMQAEFYDAVSPIWQESKKHEFPASYTNCQDTDFLGVRAKCLETYQYGGAGSYRSLFYTLMRHTSNIHGGEKTQDIRQKAKAALAGKKILELGCGPGFFLDFLKALGASEVLGIEKNEQLKESSAKLGVQVVYGDAKDLESLTGKREFDLVVSKDFLSYAVTKEDANPIMRGVYNSLSPRGLTIHTIDYGKMSEERYFKLIRESSASIGGNVETLIQNFQRMSPEQKDVMLRKNILNIGPGSLEDIGFSPISLLRLDCEDYLSITLTRKEKR